MKRFFLLILATGCLAGCASIPIPIPSPFAAKNPEAAAKQRMKQIEKHAQKKAARLAWPTVNLNPLSWFTAAVIAQHERERLSREETEYKQQIRQRERDRVVYHQRRALRREFGPAVIDAQVGIEARQMFSFGRPTIDLERLVILAREQAKKQQVVVRKRQALREQHQRRSEALARRGETCGGCGACPCGCPAPEPQREQLLDEPTKIPLLMPGELTIQFTDSGYRNVRLLRLPPERAAVCGCGRCSSCTARGEPPVFDPPPIPPKIPQPEPEDPPPKPGRSDRLDDPTASRPSVWSARPRGRHSAIRFTTRPSRGT